MPPDEESSRYGPRLGKLVEMLERIFPLHVSKSQTLLPQMLVVAISCGTITTF